jgi:hypothetical protein
LRDLIFPDSFQFPTTLIRMALPLAILILGVHLMAKNRNATGPRTVIGKKRSSQNATKFGIFSKVTLLEGESRADYESLRKGLWKSKQPGDLFEEILLDKMVSNLWRQHRVLIAENAEIQRNSEFLEFDRRRKEGKEADGPQFDGLRWNIENPNMLERCLEILGELRLGIETRGFDKERDVPVLRTIYGYTCIPRLRRTLQERYLGLLLTAEVTEEVRAREGYATPEQCKLGALRAIGDEIGYLEKFQEEQESVQTKRMEVEVLRQLVPDSPGLDRLLRYGNNLERAFDRMLTQYDRAQRMRKGQPLPPQLDVKIS